MRSFNMLAKLRACMARQDVKELDHAQRSINFHEEYHRALRTKSYDDFCKKALSLANQNKFSEIPLEPGQETIPSLVDTTIISKKPKLKNLMLSYFDISAEASHICSHLLKSINQVQTNYQFIQRALDIIDDVSPQNSKLIIFELNSFMFSNNPFSNLNNHDFKLLSEKHSAVLDHLKSMRKKVVRKTRLNKYLKNTSRICITATCGLIAITATVIATHTLTALVMAPTILSFPYKSLKKKLPKLRFSRRRFLSKVCDQLDIAAKGTYILNRDFDTLSRLVERLHGEVEHNRAMVQFCLDRKEDKFSLQMMNELKRSDAGFRKQVEELEEQVYLCLVTINRARGLVIKEMTKSCTEQHFGRQTCT